MGIERKKKICKTCGESEYIFGHGNCTKCYRKLNAKPLNRTAIRPASKKRKTVVEKDTAFYQYVWDERKDANGVCYCEECERKYGRSERSSLGQIWKRDMFSHILTKGAHPRLRRVLENINLLHSKCHAIWEFGKREEMAIYDLNQERIIELYKIEREM